MKLNNFQDFDVKNSIRRFNVIKKLLIIYAICAVIIVPLLAIYFWQDYKEEQRRDAYMRANYPLIKYENNVYGKVIKINTDPFVHIELNNGQKYIIGYYKINSYNNNNIFYLSDFIKLQDSLFKPAYRDTLYIYRDKREYIFVE